MLCSGHGDYGGGLCHCHAGWKGAECQLPEPECWDPNCSGHGECEGAGGTCVCTPGWAGRDCDLSKFLFFLIG